MTFTSPLACPTLHLVCKASSEYVPVWTLAGGALLRCEKEELWPRARMYSICTAGTCSSHSLCWHNYLICIQLSLLEVHLEPSYTLLFADTTSNSLLATLIQGMEWAKRSSATFHFRRGGCRQLSVCLSGWRAALADTWPLLSRDWKWRLRVIKGPSC